MRPDALLQTLFESARTLPPPPGNPEFERQLLDTLTSQRAEREANSRLVWRATPVFASLVIGVALWHYSHPTPPNGLFAAAVETADWTTTAPLPLAP